MQLLPAKQRAVLALRDGLGWSAREIAELLDDSTAAINSALQRARERIGREHADGTLARLHRPTDRQSEAAVIDAFLDAWADVDIPRIVALLTDDALLTMPPMDMRFDGAAAIGEFFATQPAQDACSRSSTPELPPTDSRPWPDTPTNRTRAPTTPTESWSSRSTATASPASPASPAISRSSPNSDSPSRSDRPTPCAGCSASFG